MMLSSLASALGRSQDFIYGKFELRLKTTTTITTTTAAAAAAAATMKFHSKPPRLSPM